MRPTDFVVEKGIFVEGMGNEISTEVGPNVTVFDAVKMCKT
jgi:hypothetical protein